MKILLKIAILALAILPATHTSAQHTYTVRETGNKTIRQESRLTSKKAITDSVASRNAVAPAFPGETTLQKMDRLNILNKLEIAANVGTTGLGLELATPVTKWAKVRAGLDWMPRFSIGMNFGLDSYLDDGQVGGNFERIQEMMREYTGYEMDNKIEMNSKPTMTTFKFLVDVYPLQQYRNWHVTAGFFIGGNSIGTSINKMNEMPSLLTLNIYNRMYDQFTAPDFIDKVIDEPIYGDMYLDPEVAMQLQERMLSMGRLGMHIGDFKEDNPYGKEPGSPYMMEPDEDGTVWAKAKVNRFRPYLGIGYEGGLSKDGKWNIGVDAGVQFWGGAPKVVTHEGIALNDLDNLRGKVKDYMNLMKGMAVYPSIACRLSYSF